MKVLVLGGAGYIGSHICKALALMNHQTLVLDNLSTGHREAVRWSQFIEADILDAEAL
ncbi:MAG TPA: UDP-glucose 4-epimerase GalE, partial [Methylophaga sp.]|nr:UDP-glucose 4-epimerase GalE [Methylophaga sp.]